METSHDRNRSQHDCHHKLSSFLLHKLRALSHICLSRAPRGSFNSKFPTTELCSQAFCCRFVSTTIELKITPPSVSWVSYFLISSAFLHLGTDNKLITLYFHPPEACCRCLLRHVSFRTTRRSRRRKKFPNEVLCTSLSALFTLPFQFARARKNSYEKSINYTRDSRHAVKWIAK